MFVLLQDCIHIEAMSFDIVLYKNSQDDLSHIVQKPPDCLDKTAAPVPPQCLVKSAG